MDLMTSPAWPLWVTVSSWLLLLLTTADQQGCPLDSKVTWIPFRSKWYSFMSTSGNGYSYEKAQEICKNSAPGADVVSVHNKEQNTFIVDHFTQAVHRPGEIWLAILFDTDTDTFRWNDYSALNYSNWVPGEPNEDIPGIDSCAVVETQTRQWKIVYCEENLGKSIICQTTVLAVPDKDKCSNGNKNILPTALVATASAILLIVLFVSWYAYKRKCLPPNGFNALQYNPTEQITDDCILVENEEMEYEV